ncbi:MAG: hypothetical protein MJB57_06730, partial [Gemmatimonadetes bacterium]|nr:hypothetical protein [Gemmatimonadota bacterium]
MKQRSEGLTLGFILAALGLIGLTVSCTEDPLALAADDAPGASTSTRDVSMSVTDLATWRDTTLTGFALPGTAAFSLVSNDSIFR